MSAWKSRWSWVRLVNSGDVEVDRVGAVQGQRVRGDLHRAGPVAAVEHPPEGRLQVDRLRRRPLDLLLDPADHLLHRPQQPALDPRRLEDLADQERRRRLAVGPGDPDHPQLRGRVALERGPRAAPSPPARRRPPPAAPSSSSSRSTTSAAAPASTAAARTRARRPSPRRRRRRASRARPCGCRRRGPRSRRSRRRRRRRPRALGSPRERARRSSHRRPILGRGRRRARRPIPAGRRGRAARTRRSCRRPGAATEPP